MPAVSQRGAVIQARVSTSPARAKAQMTPNRAQPQAPSVRKMCIRDSCYLWGGIESQQVAIDRDGDHRSFFYMSYDLPNYNSRWVLVDYSSFIPNINLQWQSEWAPWSPMRKRCV